MVNFVFESNESVFPTLIETERLEMRPVNHKNLSVMEMYEIYKDIPEYVTRYVTFESYDNPMEAKQFIEDSVSRFENSKNAGYVMYEKDSGDFIGTTSFDPNWEQSIAESGIFMFEDYWGNGYSTERGEAMVELAFEFYDFNYWISKCHPDNDGSIGAIENYVVENGGERVGVLPNQGRLSGDEYKDILYFKLSRQQYLS